MPLDFIDLRHIPSGKPSWGDWTPTVTPPDSRESPHSWRVGRL